MHWKLIVIFFACMLLYAALGGVAFHFIETAHERWAQPVVQEKVLAFLRNHPCLNMSHFKTLEYKVKRINQGGLIYNKRLGTLENATNWDIQSSIFVASQIIGAVGYGNITPQTVGGKVFTVLFTCVGIPLFIVLAFGLGQPIVRLVRFLENFLCGNYVELDRKASALVNPLTGQPYNDKVRKIWVYVVRIIAMFVVGMILFVIIPAAIFNALESWSYGESVYFCFVSVLSIGFGDYAPGDAADQSYRNWYRLAVGFWIYLSVAFFVVVFLPIQEALDYRHQINTPLDLSEEDPIPFPIPFDNIMGPRGNDDSITHRQKAGLHTNPSSRHSTPHTHSTGHSHPAGGPAVNQAFDYAPFDLYRPSPPPVVDNSRRISVHPTSSGSNISHGDVTSLSVNQ